MKVERLTESELVKIAHTMFHPTRLEAVLFLRNNEASKNDVVNYLNIDERLTAFHLKTLEDYGLVTSQTKDDTEYFMLTAKVDEVLEFVNQLSSYIACYCGQKIFTTDNIVTCPNCKRKYLYKKKSDKYIYMGGDR